MAKQLTKQEIEALKKKVKTKQQGDKLIKK